MNGQLNFQVTVVMGNRILIPTDTRTDVPQNWLRPVLERKIFTLSGIEPQLPNEYIQYFTDLFTHLLAIMAFESPNLRNSVRMFKYLNICHISIKHLHIFEIASSDS